MIFSLLNIKKDSSEENSIFDFLKELKKGFDQANLTLTMSFTATVHFFSTDIDISKYVAYFDYIHFLPIRTLFRASVFKTNSIEYATMEIQPSNIRQKIGNARKFSIV